MDDSRGTFAVEQRKPQSRTLLRPALAPQVETRAALNGKPELALGFVRFRHDCQSGLTFPEILMAGRCRVLAMQIRDKFRRGPHCNPHLVAAFGAELGFERELTR